jgi:hypothetical protein
METLELGLEVVKENEILMSHPLKRYLMGWVCYSYKHEDLAKFELISTKISTNNYVDLELA